MKQIWHPYTPFTPEAGEIELISAKDAVLTTAAGKQIIDAVSSWWVNPFGHGNRRLAEAAFNQILELDQVIFAGFTHQPAIRLSAALLEILPGQSRVFFSDNGSTAVEVGLKMAIQYWFNLGRPRKKIIAFQGAYHGDTFGAMAAGARGKFFAPFEDFVFDVVHITPPIPGQEVASIKELKEHLRDDAACCFIFEPLVQGAAGMVIHSAETLDEMIAICRKAGVPVIADEVMTGFGRTGKTFACDYLENHPDIICLSKCLTGGILPMAVTTCSAEIFRPFAKEDYHSTFFHGHSYTGNPTGCAVALESLSILRSAETMDNIKRISEQHAAFAGKLAGHSSVSRCQHLGTILSIEIKTGEGLTYFSRARDEIYMYFLDRGILLRPLGNVLYLMPPYCISDEQLEYVYQAISAFLSEQHKRHLSPSPEKAGL